MIAPAARMRATTVASCVGTFVLSFIKPAVVTTPAVSKIRCASLNQGFMALGPDDSVQVRIHRADLLDVRADDLLGRDATDPYRLRHPRG